MAYCPMIKYHYNFPDPILSRVMKIKALDSADAYAKRDCRIKKCNYKLPYPVVALLLFGLFAPMTAHASGTVTISVTSSTVGVGDTVTVTAWASGPNGEAAIAKMGFNYDSGKFSFVSCSEADYTGGSDGYVGVSGNNVSITLKATAAGIASVTVSGSKEIKGMPVNGNSLGIFLGSCLILSFRRSLQSCSAFSASGQREGEAANPEGETANPEGEAANPEETAANPEGTAANPEGTAEFSLVYGVSSFGNMGWYQYDTAEGFFQRYVQTKAVQETPQEEGETDSSVEMQSLQNAYKDLEEQLNEKKSSSRKTTAIMVFVIAVLLVVIVNLILRGRPGDYDEDEDDLFEDAPKPKKRTKVSQETRPMPFSKQETRKKQDTLAEPISRKKSEYPAASGSQKKPEQTGLSGAQRKSEQAGGPGSRRKSEMPAMPKIPDLPKMPEMQKAPKASVPPRMPETPAAPSKTEVPPVPAMRKKPAAPAASRKPAPSAAPKAPEGKDDFEVIDLEDL